MSVRAKKKKQQRMQKAAKLRHIDELDNREIAEKLGVSKNTIDNYFSSPEMEQLVRHYTDQEKYALQRTVEQDIHDAENEAKDALAEAKRLADSSRAYRQYAAKRMEVAEKKVKLLQEIGVYQKPAENKKVENTDTASELRKELAEIYEEEQQEELTQDA